LTDIDVLKDVVHRLNSENIKYMLSGSVSMSFYTIPRMTRNIDIIIQLATSDTKKMYNLFKDDYYIDEEMVHNAVIHHDMFNIIHNLSVFKIDFIVRKDEEFRIHEFSNRKTIEFDGIELQIVSLEDLIISKLYWMKDTESELQKKDIISLLKRKIDNAYIEYWCEKLEILDLYKRIR